MYQTVSLKTLRLSYLIAFGGCGWRTCRKFISVSVHFQKLAERCNTPLRLKYLHRKIEKYVNTIGYELGSGRNTYLCFARIYSSLNPA